MLLAPSGHLHCHHPSSPGLCSLGQPEKIWKILLVGKLVQPRWRGGCCRSPPTQTPGGCGTEEGAFNTKGRFFSSRHRESAPRGCSLSNQISPIPSACARILPTPARSLALGQGPLLRGIHRGAGWSISLPTGGVTVFPGGCVPLDTRGSARFCRFFVTV